MPNRDRYRADVVSPDLTAAVRAGQDWVHGVTARFVGEDDRRAGRGGGPCVTEVISEVITGDSARPWSVRVYSYRTLITGLTVYALGMVTLIGVLNAHATPLTFIPPTS